MAIVKQIKKNTIVKSLPVIEKKYYNSDSGNYCSSMNSLINDIDDETDPSDINIKINNKWFNMSGDDLPKCCGLAEYGDLKFDSLIDIKDVSELLDGLVTIQKGKTLMINTNGKADSLKFDAALAKCKFWTLVKTFRNSNSGNTIKIWMSNND